MKRDFKKPIRVENKQGALSASETAKIKGDVFLYNEPMTLGVFATQLGKPASEIVKFLFLNKKMFTMNSLLDDDIIGMVCVHYGLDFQKEKAVAEEAIEEYTIKDEATSLTERPPVVTIMGHVDHGKTTLIDTIRSSNLVSKEFGGISQAIGAYQRDYQGKKITFIDTPGHAAFTAMRARGAKVTDIVILVVAADDGVMPQTKEAIDHAKAAGVPIIVAINKMDKPTANSQRVKDELIQLDIIPEQYGGSNIFLEISAKNNTGIDELLESILLVAEVLELKANEDRFALGTVLEAVLDKGEGPKATLLVENGTLTSADFVVVGSVYGKVRRMTNEYNKVLKTATPSTPVSVIGLSEVPVAGDSFMAFSSEKQAKEIAEKRRLSKESTLRSQSNANSVELLNQKLNSGEVSDINLIIKADNTGSAEAIKSSLDKIQLDTVKVRVLRSEAGAITESDVLLASASSAIIYGFNIRPDATIKSKAEAVGVDIRHHRIIYALLEEVEALSKGKLKVKMVEKITGQFSVRATFKLGKVGLIAGGLVTEGTVNNASLIRVKRNGVVIQDTKVESLKRLKDEVKEVRAGFECGIRLDNFNDIVENDVFEAYQMVEDK